MKPETPATVPPFTAALLAMMHRRGLDETRTAALLGVPVYTLTKWTTGTRAPSAAAVRLLDVLGTLEAIAPGVLDALTPDAAPAAPKRARGRPPKPAVKVPNQSVAD